MASEKYHGKLTKVLYKDSIGGNPTIDLSGTSRTVGFSEQGNEIDVSTRDDFLEDATQYLTNPPGRTFTLSGLDTRPIAARVWHDIDIGDAGRVAMYPYGQSAGAPYEIFNVICTQREYNSPHDNAATYTVTWRVNGPVTAGVV